MPVVGELLRRTVQPFVNSHRILLYAALTLIAVAVTVINALRNHSNFYSVAIYLFRSSRSVLIFANLGVLMALASGKVLQILFFGPLLPAEVERLYDRIWFFVTESLLAFTIFRDEFDVPFGVMFGFLLFVKCFHWLMADRIEWMDQRPYPGPPPLFHIRILSLFTVLSLTDVVMFVFAIESTLNYGVGATVLFANEYAILTASAWNAMAKYGLSIYELRRASRRGGANAPPWEAKSMWLFYIELLTDFFKLSTYLVFFAVIMTFYGLPLNIIRDVYMTGASFVSRLAAFHRYRNATRDMDQRYPNATAEELSGEADQTCIICREEMVVPAADAAQALPADGPNMTPKKLPCGHIFHFHCLRSWLERQQNCPTCRRPVLENPTPANPAADARQPAVGPDGLPPPPANRPQGPARPWGLQARNAAGAAPRMNAPVNQGGIPGFIMRFFGAAQQPPLVPGQFGNGPLPAAAPAPGAAAGPAIPPLPIRGPRAPGQHPPGLVFEYNYVYEQGQAPRLMQPPMLQGFYREDGLWQGWPGAGGRAVNTNTPSATAGDASVRPVSQGPVSSAGSRFAAPETSAASATSGVSTDSVVPPAVDAGSEQVSSASSTRQDTDAAPEPDERPVTPRDAAALAALRRFATGSQAQRPAKPLVPQGDTTPSGTNEPSPQRAPDSQSSADSTAPKEPSATNVTDPPRPSISTPTASTPAPTRATPTSNNARVPLPSVIPLYDFGRPPASRGPSPFSVTQSPLAPMATLRPIRPQLTRAATDGPLRQLPQPATDAALLEAADALTREAIDARLRVLERVDGAVWRCVEELLRLRSVLPDPDINVTTPQPSAAVQASSSASESRPGLHMSGDSERKGKAVDPAERPGESSGATETTSSPSITVLSPSSTSGAGTTTSGLAEAMENQVTALKSMETIADKLRSSQAENTAANRPDEHEPNQE